jgi:hypothetical protein
MWRAKSLTEVATLGATICAADRGSSAAGIEERSHSALLPAEAVCSSGHISQLFPTLADVASIFP